MLVEPRVLVDVISLIPAMRPNWRSSGVATEDAMVSALAPARLAFTWMVGKSTCGSGETGKMRNATPPAMAIAAVSSVVAMGLRMKGSQIFIRSHLLVGQPILAAKPGSHAMWGRLVACGRLLIGLPPKIATRRDAPKRPIANRPQVGNLPHHAW